MASLDVATSLANLRTMLSGLAAWQSICGVATTAEAATRIHYGALEINPRNKQSSENPCIILDVSSLPTTWKNNRLTGTVTFEIRFYLTMPSQEKETYGTQYLWAWQKFSAMLDAINGAVGDAGEVMIKSLDVPLLPGRIDPDIEGGESEWNFILSLTADFI
jgi:hypothetical protein